MPALGLGLLLNFNNQADCTALVLALACLLLPVCFALWRRPGVVASAMDGPALWLTCLLGWALLSSQWAAFPHGAILHCVPLVLLLAAYIATRITLAGSPLPRLLFLFAIAAVAASIAHISELITTPYRADGWFLDPNSLAAFLSALFFPLFFWHLHARVAGKQVVALALALPLLLLFSSFSLTISKSGLAAFLLGMAAALSLVIARRRVLIKASLPILVALGLCYAALQKVEHGEGLYTPLETAANLPDFAKHPSVRIRGLLYGAAWGLYLEQPVLGHGFGMFRLAYQQVRTPNDTGMGSSTGGYVHSDPLQMLVEGGPLLLLLFLGPAFYAARLLWRSRRLDDSPGQDPSRLIGLGCAIGLVCLYLQSSVTFVFYQCATAVVAGFLLAALRHTLASPSDKTIVPPMAPAARVRLLMGLTVGLWVYLGFVAIDSLAFITWTRDNCKSAWCERWQPGFNEQHRLARLFSTLQPDAVAPRLTVIDMMLALHDSLPTGDPRRTESLEHALAEAVELLRRQPQLSQSYYSLASVISRRPELAMQVPGDLPRELAQLYLRTMDFNPLFIQAYLDLYEVYAARGEFAKGYDLLVDGALKWFGPYFMTPVQAEAVLANALQAAIRLQRWNDARDLAKALLRGAPQHPAAREYLQRHPADG